MYYSNLAYIIMDNKYQILRIWTLLTASCKEQELQDYIAVDSNFGSIF